MYERRGAGHAFHADQARDVLGLAASRPLRPAASARFDTVVGCAIPLTAVIVRPEAVGLGASVVLDGLLALITVVALVVHEHGVRPGKGVVKGIQPALLPAAALLALCLVLAGDPDWRAGAASLTVAMVIIAVLPGLGFVGGDLLAVIRSMRHLAGIVIAVPIVVAGVTPELAPSTRAAILLAGLVAAGLDALDADGHSAGRALPATVAAAAIVLVLALLPSETAAPVHAAELVVVWYASRSLLGTLSAGNLGRADLLEYGTLAMAAAVALHLTENR